MYRNTFDSHCHSHHSGDARSSVRDLIGAAREKGLLGLTVSDHCECGWPDWQGQFRQAGESVEDILQNRQTAGEDLFVSVGIELGQMLGQDEQVKAVLHRWPYDFVIGSIHALQGEEELFFQQFDTMTQGKLDQLFQDYYGQMLEMVKTCPFDIMAHMSLPLRYMKHNSGIDGDLTRYREEIDVVLRAMVEEGKGLEINTSGLRSPLKDTLPPYWVVARYRELGGELITIGSDAHRAAEVGEGIQQGMGMLEQAGFRYVCYFKERKPVMLPLL